MTFSRSTPWMFLLLAGLAAGCGGSSGLAPVNGTVTYKGQPVKQGTIGFLPEKGRPAYGKIIDGQIVQVTTLAPNDGVSLGSCKVQIQAIENADNMYAKHPSLIPEQYGDASKSGLSADIKKGGPNTLTFDLK